MKGWTSIAAGVATAVAVASFAGHATAQQLEEIVVEATPLYAEIDKPRVKYTSGRPMPGGGYEVRLQGRVNAAGLDLTDPQDEAVFRTRVTNVAWDMCQRIGELYPRTQPDTETCAKNAEDAVAAQVEGMIEKAKSAKGGG
ncbi:MAG: UrcA family protein [Steroidobacteraceae bacterium]|jgi:UrcA family protein|nr:UrcA family protein [Steroidobacteraceae bacterium]